ncbi:NADH-quinone oxidoreductase subunit L [Fangia hongkongensis]|uniref:NADH-quinone oxidoreductase subunit L n=1 Tax=Fangia hongkongensis TaxID=270495 RepID=UPI000365E3FB|nr:NADH-quinone oxidoreductase subunit L [Fangia hongkongensis]MBK2125625.1 NADH-quinone oxidoreductase subunit L [Fangia hongkongensis]
MDTDFIIAVILLAPALGAILAGFFPKKIKLSGVNFVTIILVGLSFVLSLMLAYGVFFQNQTFTATYFDWAMFPSIGMKVSFTVDRLSVFMMLIVTFVSMLVHIYSMGYMRGEEGYARFFAYISGFTFAMLCLVMGNNFLLLFFGWEGVGLFSYLLIGFYFNKDSANEASLRAFIINRVGDLGFLLGIGAVIYYTGSIDYNTVFTAVANLDNTHMISFLGMEFSPITLMCVLLFIGAMGKSAQFPLHTWLEGSMEGPTPISALIHAATMVTAGVFMVARLSPMFIHSATALSFVMIIGAITCLFMGLIAIVQMDIKRVIAYCTLSQLGYMMVAQGASGFSIGMFHLMTHAMFKALLFLAAGSVIVAMHHEQDMRKMGGLRKYMPITYLCMIIGGWALAAIPPLSGFFSKDLIIEAAQITTLPGHEFAYYLVLACAFVTSFYTFRMIFMTFHGKPRMDAHTRSHLKESPMSILIPLIVLAIASIFAGMLFFEAALTPNLNVHQGIFGDTVAQYIQPALGNMTVVSALASEPFTKTPWDYIAHSVQTVPFWLAIIALVMAYIFYVVAPSIPKYLSEVRSGFGILHHILVKKYFIDGLYELVFVKGVILLAKFFWVVIDIFLIDKVIVHGSAGAIYLTGKKLRKVQRGYIYDYALVLLIGVIALIIWLIFWVN